MGDEFWVHLNLQLIHTLDFLPIADWGSGMQYGDPFFQTFRRLYRFLQHAGKLQAKVDLDLSSCSTATPFSRRFGGSIASCSTPASCRRKLTLTCLHAVRRPLFPDVSAALSLPAARRQVAGES